VARSGVPCFPTSPRPVIMRKAATISSPSTGTALSVLAVAAVTIEIVLLWLTALMYLPRFFPGKAGITLDFVKMMGPDWQRNTAIQCVAFLVLFLAFGLALWAIRGVKPSRAVLAALFVPPIVWAITAALMYPPYAVDLFHNIADGRLVWIYHLNPMIVPPIARPFPIGMSFGDSPSAYGPFWYLLDFPPSLLQPQNYLGEVIVLKLWMAVFYVASGVLIYVILRRQRPALALFGTALYLWNPFVLIRDLADAHNDVVMLFFVLVMMYCILREEWLAVAPALALSVVVKFASLVLGPLVLVYVLRLPAAQRMPALLRLAAGGVLAVGLVIMIYFPFWVGPATLGALRAEASKSITSTPLLVELSITAPLFGAGGAGISRLLMRALFLVPYAVLLWRVRPPVQRFEAIAYHAVWLYILIATAWFRPWYLLWVVTLGALLPSGWFLALTLTISWCGMFPDIVEQYRNFMPLLRGDLLRLYAAPIVVAFALPLVVWLAGLVETRSWLLTDDAGPEAVDAAAAVATRD
jgi:hypothetical protein